MNEIEVPTVQDFGETKAIGVLFQEAPPEDAVLRLAYLETALGKVPPSSPVHSRKRWFPEGTFTIQWPWPMRVTMPCGTQAVYSGPSDFPLVDVPCPCGEKRHKLVEWQKKEN